MEAGFIDLAKPFVTKKREIRQTGSSGTLKKLKIDMFSLLQDNDKINKKLED